MDAFIGRYLHDCGGVVAGFFGCPVLKPMDQLHSILLQNPGRQDLTADVNFTDLQNWSQPWIHQQRLTSFREFLQASPDDRGLTDDHGAGGAFLVLDQQR